VKIELNLQRLLRKNLLSFLIIFCGISYGQDPDPLAGKKLFNANCAACHKLNKKAVGPALKGVTAKYDKEWLYSWIKNSSAMIKSGDAQAIAIWEEYNKSVMNNFPQLSNTDIDNILAYTDYVPPPTVAAVSNAPIQPVQDNSVSNQLILFALVLIFTILLTMLVLVNKTLKKIALANGVVLVEKEKKKNITPIWEAFVKNQFFSFC
tara:strand:+ start:2900 stop:3520 length:621 start_codon:yes stop_codon:yes gene_type:complete